jgi:hypothetical protein
MRYRLAPAWALLIGGLLGGGLLRAQEEKLTYAAEWRLLRAGEVELTRTGANQTELSLQTQGLVGKLYSVKDAYRATFDPGWCALTLNLDAREGKRHRLTQVTYDRDRGKASLLERDVHKDAIVTQNELDVPNCVHEVTGALQRLRELRPEPGVTLQLPVSDGKKSVSARVEALSRETIKTNAGEFKTVKYEAFLFSGVLYRRKGRLFVWLSEDERRLPVRIRVQLPFYIGTVTLELEKVEG